MTLDEAIKHCKEKADELNKEVLNQANLCNAREMAECQECAREHEQLAEWLKDYKQLIDERPQGDLISREALKKALHNFFDGKVIDEPAYILRDVFCYIDNAPTVDKVINVYPKGEVIVQEKRPQGKWIDKRTIEHDGEFYCSNCDEVAEWLDGGSQFLSKFCPNCGAEMRGEGQ